MTWVQDCSYFEICASFNELISVWQYGISSMSQKEKEREKREKKKNTLSLLSHKFILKPLCIY